MRLKRGPEGIPRLMRLFARLAIFSGFTAFCLGVVLTVVYLETETDVIGDVRVALGIDDGRISQNSLAFDADGSIVERVANWRAYSGPNRHLPAPLANWTREEVDTSYESLAEFRAAHQPSLVPTRAGANLGLLHMSAVQDVDGAGRVDVVAAGITGGAALYSNGNQAFMAVLQRIPPDLAALMRPATEYLTEAEKERRGLLETAIGGRVFRYSATGLGDGAYVSMTGQIGNLYLLTVEGNAPMSAIAAHVERMDFRRLEDEGAGDVDPMAKLSVFGDVLLKANGVE